MYRKKAMENYPMEQPLALFIDASYLDCAGMKSTLAFSLFYKGAPISFASKSSSIVTLSVKESEQLNMVRVFAKRSSYRGYLWKWESVVL